MNNYRIYLWLASALCIIMISNYTYAQSKVSYDPLAKPNTYRTSDNPNYWKNSLPHEGYWQQDVHYRINADIDETTDIIHGNELVTYWNNSPDTLTSVFFHLYQNAFQPDSYYDRYQKEQGIVHQYGRYEKDGLGTTIENLTILSLVDKSYYDATYEIDNTIMRVNLPFKLAPDDRISFYIEFKTYFDASTVRRRMKVFNAYDQSEKATRTSPGYDAGEIDNKHYDGVHWYPRISVYDRKFGWTTDQHLGKEFYGDFGTYDVELTFSDNMVVEATGKLQNRNDVLPDNLRSRLDINNFLQKPWNSKPGIITEYNTDNRKTWKYHAENVHDFAFTADPTYRIGEMEWNGIRTVAMVREHHASGWRNAADYAMKTIKVFSQDIGAYQYPKIIIADAKDGMEYPMITLDGGSDPGYRDLLVHEIGHNWFFGMVGNNETYRAALDEGFTQFYNVWGMEAIEGDFMPSRQTKWKYYEKFRKKTRIIDSEAYYSYYKDAVRGKDPAINIHSNQYKDRNSYRHVYYKTATMLYNLQYVLGDDLFKAAMKNYFEQWKFAHPYWDDFKKSVINFTGADLNWFFDQWINTSENIDYSINYIKNIDSTLYEIEFERKGEMEMPIDFTVVQNNGVPAQFHIPNRWFNKINDEYTTVLPRWIGFNHLNKKYTCRVNIIDGVKNVVIDPTNRLADINMLNNKTKEVIDLKFDSKVRLPANRYEYQMLWRPALWYNAFDGVKIGAHLEGDYFNYKHKFEGAFLYSTGAGRFDLFDHEYDVQFPDQLGQYSTDDYYKTTWWLNYETSIDKLIPQSNFKAKIHHIDGFDGFSLGINRIVNGKHNFTVNLKSMYRDDEYRQRNYLLYPDEWNYGAWNNVIDLGYSRNFKHPTLGNGQLKFNARSSTLFSDSQYQLASVEVKNRTKLKKLNIKTRIYGELGTGDRPAESALFLAGGNPEQMMENKFVRSKAFFPQEWTEYGNETNNFHFGGGLNIRGFAGDFSSDLTDDSLVVELYKGSSGLAFNAEIDFDEYLKIKKPRSLRGLNLDTYVFFDIGSITYENEKGNQQLAHPRLDAGLGALLTLKGPRYLNKLKPLKIRFDMPLFVNIKRVSSDPSKESDYFDFRWMLGINRAF